MTRIDGRAGDVSDASVNSYRSHGDLTSIDIGGNAPVTVDDIDG